MIPGKKIWIYKKHAYNNKNIIKIRIRCWIWSALFSKVYVPYGCSARTIQNHSWINATNIENISDTIRKMDLMLSLCYSKMYIVDISYIYEFVSFTHNTWVFITAMSVPLSSAWAWFFSLFFSRKFHIELCHSRPITYLQHLKNCHFHIWYP